MSSIQYYNKNAQSFYDRTIDLQIDDIYREFLDALSEHSKILDMGCGVGRDSRYFLNQGHQVVAFDASAEMVRLSSQVLNQPTLCLQFQDMEFHNEFDGVWANASLLHVPYEDTRMTYGKINNALSEGGVFYASYKYGDQEMIADDRTFYNMTETSILPYLEGLFEPIKICEVADTRNAQNLGPRKSWLHILCRKLTTTNER